MHIIRIRLDGAVSIGFRYLSIQWIIGVCGDVAVGVATACESRVIVPCLRGHDRSVRSSIPLAIVGQHTCSRYQALQSIVFETGAIAERIDQRCKVPATVVSKALAVATAVTYCDEPLQIVVLHSRDKTLIRLTVI